MRTLLDTIKTVKGDHAEHIHANSKCQFAIRFDRKSTVEGYDPDKLLDQYNSADGDNWQEKLNSMRREQYADHKDEVNIRKRELDEASKSLVSGGRITDPEDDEAKEWAKNYYEEIRHKSTDCQHIAEKLGIDEQSIKGVKDYLFVNGTWYNELTGENEKFVPDAAIAQSWQRLSEGKIEDIKPHDRILIQHELYEKQIKAENPGISHIEAHLLATEKYDYQKESDKYYDSISKRKKDGRQD